MSPDRIANLVDLNTRVTAAQKARKELPKRLAEAQDIRAALQTVDVVPGSVRAQIRDCMLSQLSEIENELKSIGD